MNFCACNTRETHPASECIAPWESPEDVQQNDVRALLLAVGLPDHARPYSPHAVIHRELLPALRALPLPDCPTHAACPNCREGRGHWNGERYEPTEESRAANHRHVRCTCHVGSDAIGPHTRGCPNHPEATL